MGNASSDEAQQDSRRAGVPNVYILNGILQYELPTGSLSTMDPLGQQKIDGVSTDRA